MNEYTHTIFRDILATIAPKNSTFAKPSMKTMSAKEYYSLPYPGMDDDDSYSAWNHQQQLDQQQQEEQQG